MLDELLRVLPPPKRPLDQRGDWASVEAALGLRLPSDYKEFISVYGSGRIGTSLVIANPFHWLRHGQSVRATWSDWAKFYPDIAEYGEVIPYPVYPQPGGLLPFGEFGDVNILNWLTVGEPDLWPFLYYDRDQGFFEIKGLGAVEFILEAVTQRSPLMIRTNDESAFEPPCDFEADPAHPRFVRLVCDRPLDLHQVAEQIAARWSSDQVKLRDKPEHIRLVIEPLGGSIEISQEGTDDRRWISVNYDGAHEDVAGGVIRQVVGMGFTVLERSPAEPSATPDSGRGSGSSSH
jgi:SMI1-KNR4 cell-wall